MEKSILRDKNFLKLLIGGLASALGSNMQQFALSLYVLERTQSATLFGSMVAIAVIPRLLLSPVAGVIGDWFDRKTAVVRWDLLNAIVIALFAAYMWQSNALNLPAIFALVIYLEIVEIFFGAAMSGIMPSMLRKEQLPDANRIKSAVSGVSEMLAPLIAAALYSLLGLFPLFFINALSFFLSALLEMTLTVPQSHKRPEHIDFKQFTSDLKSGIAIIKNDLRLRTIIGFAVGINFSLGTFLSIGILYIIKNVLGISSMLFGIFAASISLATVVSPLLLGGIIKTVKPGKLLFSGMAVITVLIGGIALIVSPPVMRTFTPLTLYWVLFALVFIIGAVAALINVSISILFQTIVPLEYMGRTASTMSMGMLAAMPLGQMLIGISLDIGGAFITALIVLGILSLLLLMYGGKCLHMERDAPEPGPELSPNTP